MLDDAEIKRMAETSDMTIRCRACGAGWLNGPLWVRQFWAWVDGLRGMPCREGPCKFVRVKDLK